MSWLADHDIDTDTHLTEEERKEKLWYIRAEAAIRDAKVRLETFYQIIEETERNEVREFGTTLYKKQLKLWKFCGDLPILKSWWKSCAYEVDKLRGVPFWYEEEDFHIDLDWYTKSPDNFYQVRRLLTPRAKEREFGRVFFSTATTYIEVDSVYPTSRIQVVRDYKPVVGKKLSQVFDLLKKTKGGYYKIGEDKCYGTFERKPRSEFLYHPPRTGFSTYNGSKYLYRHTGTGILKRLTFEGQRYRYFRNRVEYLHYRIITRFPFTPENTHYQFSVGATLFDELRRYFFDFDTWINIFDTIVPEHQGHREEIQHNASRRLWDYQRKLEVVIRKATLRRIKHSILVRRVQRCWRSRNTTTSRFGVLSARVQRGWRRYVVRCLGTTRTVKGLLGKRKRNI